MRGSFRLSQVDRYSSDDIRSDAQTSLENAQAVPEVGGGQLQKRSAGFESCDVAVPFWPCANILLLTTIVRPTYSV